MGIEWIVEIYRKNASKRWSSERNAIKFSQVIQMTFSVYIQRTNFEQILESIELKLCKINTFIQAFLRNMNYI